MRYEGDILLICTTRNAFTLSPASFTPAYLPLQWFLPLNNASLSVVHLGFIPSLVSDDKSHFVISVLHFYLHHYSCFLYVTIYLPLISPCQVRVYSGRGSGQVQTKVDKGQGQGAGQEVSPAGVGDCLDSTAKGNEH